MRENLPGIHHYRHYSLTYQRDDDASPQRSDGRTHSWRELLVLPPLFTYDLLVIPKQIALRFHILANMRQSGREALDFTQSSITEVDNSTTRHTAGAIADILPGQ